MTLLIPSLANPVRRRSATQATVLDRSGALWAATEGARELVGRVPAGALLHAWADAATVCVATPGRLVVLEPPSEEAVLSWPLPFVPLDLDAVVVDGQVTVAVAGPAGICVYDRSYAGVPALLLHQDDHMLGVRFSGGAALLAVTSAANLGVWRDLLLEDDGPFAPVETPNPARITALEFCGQDKLAVAHWDGAVHLYGLGKDPFDLVHAGLLVAGELGSQRVTRCAWAPDGQTLAVAQDTQIDILHPESLTRIGGWALDAPVRGLAATDAGLAALTVDETITVRPWFGLGRSIEYLTGPDDEVPFVSRAHRFFGGGAIAVQDEGRRRVWQGVGKYVQQGEGDWVVGLS